jgi:hypothetical protein
LLDSLPCRATFSGDLTILRRWPRQAHADLQDEAQDGRFSSAFSHSSRFACWALSSLPFSFVGPRPPLQLIPMQSQTVSINRAPVLTLWAAIVAERLGVDKDEVLTLGKALAGLNPQAKGRRLGIFKAHEEKTKKAPEMERGEELPTVV